MVSNLFSQWKSDLISVLNKDCQEFMSVMQLLSSKSYLDIKYIYYSTTMYFNHSRFTYHRNISQVPMYIIS